MLPESMVCHCSTCSSTMPSTIPPSPSPSRMAEERMRVLIMRGSRSPQVLRDAGGDRVRALAERGGRFGRLRHQGIEIAEEAPGRREAPAILARLPARGMQAAIKLRVVVLAEHPHRN